MGIRGHNICSGTTNNDEIERGKTKRVCRFAVTRGLACGADKEKTVAGKWKNVTFTYRKDERRGSGAARYIVRKAKTSFWFVFFFFFNHRIIYVKKSD